MIPFAMFMHFTDKSIYEKFGVKYVVPMTAKEVETEEEQDLLLADPNYIGEEKLDGTRATLHFRKPKVLKDDGTFETDYLKQSLIAGSNFEGGKERIYRFFLENKDRDMRADFLKKEYGVGGRSFKEYFISYFASGYTFKEFNTTTEVSYMWKNIANVISELIDEGYYYPAKAVTRCFSRRISVKTDWFTENTDSVPHLRDLCFPELEGTVIDGEMRIPNRLFKDVASTLNCNFEEAIKRQEKLGKIVFHAFDITHYKGVCIEKMPLMRRKDYLQRVIKALNSPYVVEVPFYEESVPIRICAEDMDKLIEKRYPTLYNEVLAQLGDEPESEFSGNVSRKAYYEYIVLIGGEGVMLKPKNGKYLHKRGKEYLKIKKFITREVIIMGFTPPTKEYTGKFPKDQWEYWVDEQDLKLSTVKAIMIGSAKKLLSMGYTPVTRNYYKDLIGNIRYGVIITDEEIAKLPKNKKFTIESWDFLGDGNTVKVVEVGECSGIDDEMREFMSERTTILTGSVIEVKANEIFKDTGKLRHPRFLRFRRDCNVLDQTWKNHLSY